MLIKIIVQYDVILLSIQEGGTQEYNLEIDDHPLFQLTASMKNLSDLIILN